MPIKQPAIVTFDEITEEKRIPPRVITVDASTDSEFVESPSGTELEIMEMVYKKHNCSPEEWESYTDAMRYALGEQATSQNSMEPKDGETPKGFADRLRNEGVAIGIIMRLLHEHAHKAWKKIPQWQAAALARGISVAEAREDTNKFTSNYAYHVHKKEK